MRIRWTPAAAADLQHINDYLREHHPRYRQPTMRKLYEAVGALKQSPQRGRAGREEGTRELLFLPLPYVAVYCVIAQSVEVLRIYHMCARPGLGLADTHCGSRPHRPIPIIFGGFQPVRLRWLPH
jgi:toxin ParE1/3/4